MTDTVLSQEIIGCIFQPGFRRGLSHTGGIEWCLAGRSCAGDLTAGALMTRECEEEKDPHGKLMRRRRWEQRGRVCPAGSVWPVKWNTAWRRCRVQHPHVREQYPHPNPPQRREDDERHWTWTQLLSLQQINKWNSESKQQTTRNMACHFRTKSTSDYEHRGKAVREGPCDAQQEIHRFRLLISSISRTSCF